MIRYSRGDTHREYRQLKDVNGNNLVLNALTDRMYFTVKSKCNDSTYLIQKTLEDGITYDSEKEYYVILLTPSDTNGLEFGSYVYDIEIIIGVDEEVPEVATREKGNFVMESEVTFSTNEQVV